MSKKAHGILVILLVLVFCEWRHVMMEHHNEDIFGGTPTLYWATTLFFIGAFIKRCEWKQHIRFPLFICMVVGLVALPWYTRNMFLKDVTKTRRFVDHESGHFVLGLSVLVVTFFSTIEAQTPWWLSKFLSRVPQYVFGVYLLHEHTLVRLYLWSAKFWIWKKFQTLQTNTEQVLFILGVAGKIFVLGFAIEIIRGLVASFVVENKFVVMLLDKFVDQPLKNFVQKIEFNDHTNSTNTNNPNTNNNTNDAQNMHSDKDVKSE